MIPITCNAVGDILALATLVLDIAHALDESRGSSAKYRAFNSELKSLHIVLASVARVAELTTDIRLRDEIVREVDRCGKDVRRALEQVAKFSALGRVIVSDDVLRVRMKRQWYKLEWRFAWHGSVEAIREELASTTQRLTSYLVISNADGIQNLGVSIASQFDAMTAHVCTTVMEQFAAADRRDASLARAVDKNTVALGQLQLASRYSPPALSGVGLDSNKAAAAALLCYAICTMHDSSRSTHAALLLAAFGILMFGMARDGRTLASDVKYTQSNSITLHDAMGRRLVLPLELCETRELFHATLVNLFSRTHGRWFIDSHRYHLALKRGASRIDNWFIRPDTEVEMVVIVQYGRNMSIPCLQCPVCLVVKQIAGYGERLSTVSFKCSCGRELQTAFETSTSWQRLGTFADTTLAKAPQSIEYDVNDLGRFPRARPATSSGTQRRINIQPRTQQDSPSRHRQPLPAPDNQSEHILDWRRQVDGFTRFFIPQFILSTSFHSSENRPELHVAAENGHRALVVELLRRGADVNAAVASGRTALHLASLHGHTSVVELLLDYGATIDAATEDDYMTPLACAVYYNRFETTALLVARGAIVDAPEPMRATVLYAAAMVNNVDIVQMLLHLGLDPDVLYCGQTVLQHAVYYGFRDTVEVLLRNRANINVHNFDGESPLSVAVSQQDVEIFALLCGSGGIISLTSPTASEQATHSLLYNAVCLGNPVIVEMILRHTRVDPDVRFEDGTIPLSLASERGHEKVVELLLAQGADMDAEASPPSWVCLKSQGSWKALHAAAYDGRVKVVQMLIQYGADVNVRRDNGDTPLSFALEGMRSRSWVPGADFVGVVDALLSSGAVEDERASCLSQELESQANSPCGNSNYEVPGAWHDM